MTELFGSGISRHWYVDARLLMLLPKVKVAMGTSESFMHHPANDRSWPKIASDEVFASVRFEEIRLLESASQR